MHVRVHGSSSAIIASNIPLIALLENEKPKRRRVWPVKETSLSWRQV